MSTDRPEQSLGPLEPDRLTLRVRVRPYTKSSPIQAAWDLGRICNEMRFRFQTAWIRYSDDDPPRTIQLWTDAAALIRRIMGVQKLDAIETLERARRTWEQTFGNMWHCEDILEAEMCLKRYLHENEPLPVGANEIDFLMSICQHITKNMKQLGIDLLTAFPPSIRSAFCLGQIADELIHPPLCSRVVRVVRATGTFRGWQESLAIRAHTQERVLLAPNQITQPWPDANWRRAVAHQHAEFCDSTGAEKDPNIFGWNDETALIRILDDLAACVDDIDVSTNQASTLTRRGLRNSRELGLTLDVSGKRLRSARCGTEAKLAPRLCSLLIHYLNRGDVPTPAQWLSKNWGLFVPNRPTLEVDSVRTTISQLNELLKNHGVTISPGEGGYTITARPN